jgi:hypothetical protein
VRYKRAAAVTAADGAVDLQLTPACERSRRRG